MNRLLSRLLCGVLIFGVLLPHSLFAADHFRFRKYAKQPAGWFASPEALGIADNLLASQRPNGSWPKNIDTSQSVGPPIDARNGLGRGTFDNGATCGEIRFLGHVYMETGQEKYLHPFLKGVDHVLEAQYENGGWPQYFPPKGYAKHITFNDNTMVNLMNLVRDLANDDVFSFLDDKRKDRLKQAFDRGIDCIVDCQIRVDGELTAWCAQHDSVTFQPRGARTYEHPSLSGSESVSIIRLLMSLQNPSPQVCRSIESACRWFEKTKLTGIKQVKVDGDKKIVPAKDASPLWARFYEIGTNRPIFSGRDGVIKYSLAEIEVERRNGYSWYSTAAQSLPRQLKRWRTQSQPD